MYPEDANNLKALGQAAEELLRQPQRWVVRRKESIGFADDRVVRRTMSIDYDLCDWAEMPSHHAAAGVPVFYAPLFFLQKGSDDLPTPGPIMAQPEPLFASFDLRAADGGAMSLPPRHWNASVSIEALDCAMRTAADRLGVKLDSAARTRARSVLTQLARGTRNESVLLLEQLLDDPLPAHELRPMRRLLREDPTFGWLALACAESSVAMIPLVGHGALQGIVKLAFTQEVHKPPFWRVLLAGAGLRGYEVWLDTPYIGARTHHIELAAPDGVEIYDAGVIPIAESEPDGPNRAHLQRQSAFASQVHLYVDDATDQHGVLTWIRLRSRRQGFVGVAASVSVLVTSVLWVAYALLATAVASSPSGAPELLLLFPGLIAAYVARPGVHPFTTRLLFLARMTLLMLSATPYVAAAALALMPRSHDILVGERFRGWWLACAITASACALMLTLAWLLPQPLRTRQRYLHRPIKWAVGAFGALIGR